MLKNTLLIIVVALLFSGCFGSEDKESSNDKVTVETIETNESWTAWVYPDVSNIKRSLELGQYPSLEQCKTASLSKLEALKLTQRGTYKCGLNCSYNEGLKTLICEKLSK